MPQCDHCGGCSGGGCGGCGRELALSEGELSLLERFAQIPFLPVCRRADSETPIYLEDETYPAEEYSAIIAWLELKGLICLDYHLPLQNFDYAAYGDYPLHGSMALTALGQEALEALSVTGVQGAGYTHRFATLSDLDTLVESRVEVLREANGLDDEADLSAVARASRAYYEKALEAEKCLMVLVYDGERLIGTGGVSFYQVMPTYHNPSGQRAYLMNMYTAPSYRRQGVARRTLELLVEQCRSRGVTGISLEATAKGRPLYEAFGFVPMRHEMELPTE